MESNNNEENNMNRCENEAQKINHFEKLPREVTCDILSRLPLPCLMECKLVSKLHYSSVKHSLTISMHLSRAKHNNPYLICFSDYPISKLDFVDLNSNPENDIFLTKTPILPFDSAHSTFDVVGSCNGLICLYNRSHNDPLFIFNPFTKEYRELPQSINPPHLNAVRVVFGFGFHPRTKEYKAIKIVYYIEGNNFFTATIKETRVYVLNLGDSEWRCIAQKPHNLIICPASDVLVNGNLHWLTVKFDQNGEETRQDIVSFDLATEEFQVIPQPMDLGLNKSLTHLVTLNDRLSAVVSSQIGQHEIWVLKDYNVRESWSKEMVIPGYVPLGFRMDSAPPARIRYNGSRRRSFRVLGSLHGGDEILFSYRDRCLVSFNPDREEFKDFRTEGLPVVFETIVHMGSLISLDEAFANHPTQHHPIA
ncbi:F-box protein At3g07870-like [Humulus lupulus]|uniref:F-box protein At3g07870-like n=1 Tax=Humulus lupulus TaxID=3486 RepID=UPI002B410FD8|nr:F-box protein At3g07870-like [Humulus lupulus]